MVTCFSSSHDAESAPGLWQALADPTRRALIDRLADGRARPPPQLCEGMPMSRFGVMKHLGILERAGLVVARRHGRLRFNHLNAAPLHALQARWLSPRAARSGRRGRRLFRHIGRQGMTAQKGAETGVVEVALEWPVAASVQKVWEALFGGREPGGPPSTAPVAPAPTMSLEPALGGELARGAGRAGARLVHGSSRSTRSARST